jgi:opacity protein-like surface antigen
MRGKAWILCALMFLLVAPARACAEGFVDAFAGVALTSKGNVETSFGGQQTSGDLKHKNSFTAGGRAGWWFGLFGFNLDVAYFRPEFDPDDFTVSGVDPVLGPFTLRTETDLNVVGVGLNAMLRGQFLKTSTAPSGQLQPYIFAGPTVFISSLDVDQTLSAAGASASASDSDTSTKLGVTAGGGVTFLFTNNIGIFAEYRFTHVKPEFEIGGVKVEPNLDTHHILSGVTFRF